MDAISHVLALSLAQVPQPQVVQVETPWHVMGAALVVMLGTHAVMVWLMKAGMLQLEKERESRSGDLREERVSRQKQHDENREDHKAQLQAFAYLERSLVDLLGRIEKSLTEDHDRIKEKVDDEISKTRHTVNNLITVLSLQIGIIKQDHPELNIPEVQLYGPSTPEK